MKLVRGGRTYFLLLCMGTALLLLSSTTCIDIDPSADFSCTPEEQAYYLLQEIQFDASPTDPGGGLNLTYEWTFGDGERGSGLIVDHAYSAEGEYTVTLLVTSDAGAYSEKRESLRVNAKLLVGPKETGAAFQTISDAVEYSTDGQTIVVKEGIYKENIDLGRKSLHLTSEYPDDEECIRKTRIRGIEGGISVINIGGGQTNSTVVEGFTITTQSITEATDGAVCISGSSPIIRWNTIRDHKKSCAMVLRDSAALVVDNTFVNNVNSQEGGAIRVYAGAMSPQILRNVFEANSAPSGGAIYVAALTDPSSPAEIAQNNFVGNSATGGNGSGGAICALNESLINEHDNSYEGNTPDRIGYVK